MNLDKLFEAEAKMLQVYPLGFEDPGIAPIRKKHNVDALTVYTKENLTRLNCQNPDFVADTLLKIVSRSSMVSRFEKPPFKAFIETLGPDERKMLALALEDRLYGKKKAGFEDMVGLFSHHKVAKWTVLTAAPFYFAPRREVFVKPNTAKGILKALEIEDVKYTTAPTWEFYRDYKKVLTEVKKQVNKSLSPSYAALSGFLMMGLGIGPRPPK